MVIDKEIYGILAFIKWLTAGGCLSLTSLLPFPMLVTAMMPRVDSMSECSCNLCVVSPHVQGGSTDF